MSRDFGNVVKVKTESGDIVKRRLEKGFENIDDNLYFVLPVVRVEGQWYEISSRNNRKGHREIVKKFKGDRVGGA